MKGQVEIIEYDYVYLKNKESKHGLFKMGHIKDDFKNFEFHSYLIIQL